ncbi:MAG: type II toxin-antitoxin system HicA family toxin [Desulfobacteraceae bacterium]|nr:type II toxin-antitoxin system HicA family toxin [Desulfobacteraceae bacterium]
MPLRKKHHSTLSSIFAEPTRVNIHWNDIETLLIALGSNCTEGKGSRLRVALNDRKAVFHRPHPEKEASKSMVRSVRRFLEEAGIEP